MAFRKKQKRPARKSYRRRPTPESYRPPTTASGRIIRLIIALALIAATYFLAAGFALALWVPVGWVVLYVLLPAILPETWVEGFKQFMRVILFMGLLFYAGYFAYSFYVTGAYKQAEISVEETGAPAAAESGIAYWIDMLTHPEKLAYDYARWGKPDVAEETVQRGIRFTSLESRRDYYVENEEVRVYGTVSIDALPTIDTNVAFTCVADINGTKVNGTLTLLGYEGNRLTVYSGQKQFADFSCTFDKGFTLTKPTEFRIKIPEVNLKTIRGVYSFGGDLSKSKEPEFDVQTYTVTVYATYAQFSTTSSLKIYNIKNENLRRLEDPFENIRESLLGSDRKMRSQCLRGCGLTKLSLKSSTQPQTELGEYRLGINLRSDVDWYGNLAELTELRVKFPDTFDFVSCDNFAGDDTLDANDPYLAIFNEKVVNDEATTNDHIFYCDYTITQPREFIGYDEILVRAVYDYALPKKTTVNILKLAGEEEIEDNDFT